MMTPATLANLLWLTEGLLEAAGAWYFWRRRIPVLWAWLLFRFAADLACALLPSRLYQPTDYTQRHIQYLFWAAACTFTAWRILRERKKFGWYVGGICTIMALAIVQVHSVWPLDKQAILSLEIWAEFILAALVAFAIGMAHGRPPRPWLLIGSALIVMGVSDAIITRFRQHGWHVEGWYPLGDILSLGMLAWAGWRDYRLDEARLPLAAKKPPTCEDCSAKIMELYG